MVVDDNDRIAVDVEQICHAHIAGGSVFDAFLRNDGVFAEKHHDLRGIFHFRGVAIRVYAHCLTQLVAAHLVGLCLLQTDDVGIAVVEVFEDRVGLIFLDIPWSKQIYIVRDDFEASVGRGLLEIQGQIVADGRQTQQKSNHGNQDSFQLEDDPEEQKKQVDNDKEREQQAEDGNGGIVLRMEMAGIAGNHHGDDGNDVDAGNHF